MTHSDPLRPYVLGHAAGEHDRLDLQGVLYRDITLSAFLRAGLGPGMCVLDLGCGSGDVSLLAGEIVGPSGSVVGVDGDAGTVDRARARAEGGGAGNVSFLHEKIDGDLDGKLDGATFDAVVGRFILMHLDEPAQALAGAARCLSPGGTVAIIESNMETLLAGDHSRPHSRLYARIIRWKCAVVKSAGADLRAGLGLRRVFVDAGLPSPTTRMEAPVEGGPDSVYYRYVAESVRSMIPRAEEAGLDDFEPEDVETLEEDLRDEVVAGGGVLVAWPVVSAWCRVP
jgi:ubiquinone/menaquinone biosynthesis C-methylase UbiE